MGIDLGTTNSAVAMMLPRRSNSNNINVPTMIEIDSRTTLPSVVAFVPSNYDDDLMASSSLSMPPWTTNEQQPDNSDITWPTATTTTTTTATSTYKIYTGNQAIQYERYHPNSSFRNVKRVIGTGGKMASLAIGVVPNLVLSSSQQSSSPVDSSVSDDISNFLMMHDDDITNSNNNKQNNKQKKDKTKKGKRKRKKEDELPKLHKQLEQAQLDPALLSCTIHNNDNDDDDDDESYTLRPEQISACILRKLFDVAEEQYCMEHNENKKKVKVTRAVIGVPAYFTEAQRHATIRASELAGVYKVKLLPEPEAAALAYGNVDSSSSSDSDSEIIVQDELILVFDLGGGTFDVSILEVGGGFTEVLATVGNNRLGGTDFDRRVAEYLSGKAVEFGRKSSGNKSSGNNGSGGGGGEGGGVSVKDWYRRGSGEVQDIMLRVAEDVRKCLTNQKTLEILVPLTEEGWKKLGGGGSDEGGGLSSDEDNTTDNKFSFIGPFDTNKLESKGWVDGQDYIVATIDRKIFEVICANELQMLLQPIREVAIMAGALLPGEARPSFVESALAMEKSRNDWEDGEDFWEFDDDDDEADEEDGLLLKMKGGREVDEEDTSEVLNEQALEQIQLMDLKAQKKAQQRGRRQARDIDKKERSFRKQKQSAMEDATTASLLGKQSQKKKNQSMSQQVLSQSEGTKKVQEGIHGRVLSRIVLVGGATRMPVIGKLLEAVVGQTPQRTVNPDEAVALGCAVQAGILDGEDQGQTVLSPMAAAVMRALAKKRGMMVPSSSGDDDGGMKMGSGISGMIVDEFDDEDDFY